MFSTFRFAPDYSGACAAVIGLGGLTVIHNTGGCSGAYIASDEPRLYGSRILCYSSDLKQMDAIMGNDDVTIDKIVNTAEYTKPPFIAIASTPVPTIIGTDMEAMAMQVEQRTGIPSIFCPSTGIKYYDEGISNTLLSLAKHFLSDPSEKIPKSVNLLGATPLDIGMTDNIKGIQDIFEQGGFTVVSTWSMNSSIEDIKKASGASINIVLSYGGFKTAVYMQKKYGIPYCVGVPYGLKGTEVLIDNVEAIRTNKSCKYGMKKDGAKLSDKVLIIGEQVNSDSMRRCLNEDFEYEFVDIASFFGMDKNIFQENDIRLKNEEHLSDIMNSGKYKIIMGDPLYKDLLNRDVIYINIPHMAVSSFLYAKDYIDISGYRANEWLKTKILSRKGEY
nr:nitrogenase component 1 [Sedimentibacter sp.]